MFLNAIANQLRYPNNHTHYFSCVLLFLFETCGEVVQEQITRVLLERLIVHRPHPWGLLITFIELIKNPRCVTAPLLLTTLSCGAPAGGGVSVLVVAHRSSLVLCIFQVRLLVAPVHAVCARNPAPVRDGRSVVHGRWEPRWWH